MGGKLYASMLLLFAGRQRVANLARLQALSEVLLYHILHLSITIMMDHVLTNYLHLNLAL